MIKILKFFLVLIIFLQLFISCKKKDTLNADFTILPSTGEVHTVFIFDASNSGGGGV